MTRTPVGFQRFGLNIVKQGLSKFIAMFQKIETNLGPELLQPGMPVICFPLNGRKYNHIDLSDIENFMLYIVTSVRNGIVSMELTDDTFLNTKTENDGRYLIKFFHELIAEGKWWARLTF